MEIINIIKLFLTALTITVGIITIAIMVWKTHSSQSIAFQLISKVILFFNLSMMVSLFYQEFLLHIRHLLNEDLSLILSYLFLLSARLLQLLMLYYVVQFVGELRGMNIRKSIVLVAKITIGVLTFCMLTGSFVEIILQSTKLFFISTEVTAFIVQFVSLFSCVYTVNYSLSIDQPERKRSVAFLGSSYAVFLSGVILLNISLYLWPQTGFLKWPLEAILDIVINSAVLLWVWKFSEALTDTISDAAFGRISSKNAGFDRLTDDMDITRREKEIIELICMGKSNQEIADDLYISLKTVKAHIYNIFQKTGVKRRVQLTKLFQNIPHPETHS